MWATERLYLIVGMGATMVQRRRQTPSLLRIAQNSEHPGEIDGRGNLAPQNYRVQKAGENL